MVNIGLNWSSFVGIALMVSGASLFFLRSFRPNLARDHDIFFAAIALISGLILFFNGWRQDPILQFGQSMVAGSAIFFAVESIRLRAVTTVQAKRAASAPLVDEDRPVSRVYRAELDELEPYDERAMARRIRGSRDPRSKQMDAYMDDYDDQYRRSSGRNSATGRIGPSDSERPPRRRPPSRSSTRPNESSGWEAWDDEPPARPPSRRPGSDVSGPPPRSGGPSDRRPSRPPRPRDGEGSGRTGGGMNPNRSSSDYVDYQPIDSPDDRPNRPRDFE